MRDAKCVPLIAEHERNASQTEVCAATYEIGTPWERSWSANICARMALSTLGSAMMANFPPKFERGGSTISWPTSSSPHWYSKIGMRCCGGTDSDAGPWALLGRCEGSMGDARSCKFG